VNKNLRASVLLGVVAALAMRMNSSVQIRGGPPILGDVEWVLHIISFLVRIHQHAINVVSTCVGTSPNMIMKKIHNFGKIGFVKIVTVVLH